MSKHHTLLLLTLLITLTNAPQAYGATPGECEVLQRANPAIKCDKDTVITEQDTALGISNQVAKAKEYLLSKAKDLRNSKAPPTCPANIYRLNNTFAVCLARFVKAVNNKYGDGAVTVVSAFRSPDPNDACGSNKAAGGAPNSNHQKGLAADVAPGNGLTYNNLQDLAKANPQFGLCFPYVPRLTSSRLYDRPHMTLAGINTGEAKYCAQQGITKYCDQSPAYDPNQLYNPPPQTGSTGAPNTQPYGYGNNPYTNQPQPTNPYQNPQSPQVPHDYSTQPEIITNTQSYTPYSGIYGEQFNPPTSKYDQLVSSNPDNYQQSTKSTDNGSVQSTSPANLNTTQIPSTSHATALGNTLLTSNPLLPGLPISTSPTTVQSSGNTQQPNGLNYMQSIQNINNIWSTQDSYNSYNNSPSFIPLDNTHTTNTTDTSNPQDPYSLYNQGQVTPDWVDNSFNDLPKPKSWWQRFIGFFGF